MDFLAALEGCSSQNTKCLASAHGYPVTAPAVLQSRSGSSPVAAIEISRWALRLDACMAWYPVRASAHRVHCHAGIELLGELASSSVSSVARNTRMTSPILAVTPVTRLDFSAIKTQPKPQYSGPPPAGPFPHLGRHANGPRPVRPHTEATDTPPPGGLPQRTGPLILLAGVPMPFASRVLKLKAHRHAPFVRNAIVGDRSAEGMRIGCCPERQLAAGSEKPDSSGRDLIL